VGGRSAGAPPAPEAVFLILYAHNNAFDPKAAYVLNSLLPCYFSSSGPKARTRLSLPWLFLKQKVSLVCCLGLAWSFPELPYYRRSADFLTG